MESTNHKTIMLAKVCSAAVNGIEAYPVEVEVHAGWGDSMIVVAGACRGERGGVGSGGKRG